ncbi:MULTISPECIES: hypothetical protein [unclassified Bradyrhizobium]|uniref:hypothetical protein n=1 Tax=unclassified Bradyrhizobium TaxID=2631580 RepID=UPI0024787E1E|nr:MULTISPECIES: hypothetical protein [unclassified Bradyrhizobium]WGR68966.1 hypothetical protein MTX24_26500 [Bradyrhizobium sp. ISRA426]WGR81021.1 hypothetical protein MTX21_11615 [Bradyrhizobium sp. ISRA430]WGR84205.1 hypothetical protein MTX25_26180 [Bradyrhizobium sp. ISRA432]
MPDPPLNMSDDIIDMIVLECGVLAAQDSPHELLGTVTLVTQKGHYDFLIDEEAANQLAGSSRSCCAKGAQTSQNSNEQNKSALCPSTLHGVVLRIFSELAKQAAQRRPRGVSAFAGGSV